MNIFAYGLAVNDIFQFNDGCYYKVVRIENNPVIIVCDSLDDKYFRLMLRPEDVVKV